MKLLEGGISIIVPVYNGEYFIETAYKNILNQHLTNFEILFIDNNSTDASVVKISKILQIDSRVSFYKETKQGAAAARNKGIEKAQGEFIHFFDVDDQLFNGALIALNEVLKNNPEVFSVFGNIIRTKNQFINLENSVKNTNSIVLHKNPSLGLVWLKSKSQLPNPSTFLHRRAVFSKIKGFQVDLLIGEDAFFHVRLANEFNLAYLDRDIVAYFRHPNSTVSQQNSKVVDKVFTYWPQTIKAYLPYSINHKVSKEFKVEVLKQIFWAIGKMIVLTEGFKQRKFF